MSGIIAHVGPVRSVPVLLDGLKRLVQHGHDSAGLALCSRDALERWRALAPLGALERRVPHDHPARCGIAHTRLATQGTPTERNAHPHFGGVSNGSARVALVHNGVVENVESLRQALRADGVELHSGTDSEVLAQRLASHLGTHTQTRTTLEEALHLLLGEVRGTCGLAALDRDAPDSLVVASVGSPMHVGHGDSGSLAASDAAILRGQVREIVTLNEGGVARLAADGFHLTTPGSAPASTTASTPAREAAANLHVEILAQPLAIERVLAGRLDRRFASVRLGGLNLDPSALRGFRRVHLLGAGSSWHAALAGACMIESLARLPARAEPAGEFLCRDPVIEPDTLYLAASRSGETGDTLAAVREIRLRGGTVLGVVNEVGSRVARAVSGGMYLHAGAEHSVIATKTVSAMLGAFALLALYLGRMRDVSPQHGARLLDAFDALASELEALLARENAFRAVATRLAEASSVLFTGCASGHAIALEGARKLVETTAIPALACPLGELAHGPIALLGAHTPCVLVLCGSDASTPLRRIGRLVAARRAPLVLLGGGDAGLPFDGVEHHLSLPAIDPLLEPILAGAALQMTAWHTGAVREQDVDHPQALTRRAHDD